MPPPAAPPEAWEAATAAALEEYRLGLPMALAWSAATRGHPGALYLRKGAAEAWVADPLLRPLPGGLPGPAELAATPPDPAAAAGWYRVKRAAGPWRPLKPAWDAWVALQRPLGGPGAWQAALTGGLLGAAAGAGGGALLGRLLPEDRFDRRRPLATGALLGGLLGAAPGVAWGLAAPKRADAGLLAVPAIPVDRMGRTIWADAGSGTPVPAAAAAAGLLAGAGALAGRRAVSPLDVALAAGQAGAGGFLGGMALGRVLGALAGLRPESQAELQRYGLWGGLVSGAVARALGG
jgi:hypothetical protein